MNAGITISFVIGGLLLLSIVGFNRMVMSNSQEAALSSMTQQSLDTIVELITNDFNKIGFGATAVPIVTMSPTNFRFWADVYDADGIGTTLIQWNWDTSDAASSSSNPNDFKLKRTGPVDSASVGTIEVPVTFFNIQYLSGNNSPTVNPTLVRKIEVEVLMESPEPYRHTSDGTPVFFRTGWKRVFVPNNLNLPF